jgi:DNA-binding transcriptional LysR family regulator
VELAGLEIFVDVARRLSFSEVARNRRIEPSSVSRVIANIEGELGERLFHRTTRKLSLTEAGTLYLARIEPLVSQLEDAKREVTAIGRKPLGNLRLSTSVAFGQTRIVPLLNVFRQRYPDLKLELLLDDANLDLVREGIDLAIRLAPGVEANVIVSKLVQTRYHVVAAPDWLAAHPLASPADLQQHPVLRFTLPGYRDRWLFRNDGGETSVVPVNGDLLISNALGLRDAALSGLGPALLADWLIGRDLREGRLIDCFPSYRATATEFDTAAWLIYPSRTYLPTKVRIMIDFLREQLEPSALR